MVTIEDTAELQLQQVHVAGWKRRPANVEGKGAVTQRDCSCATRCACAPTASSSARNAAARRLDMLQAMNTGHDGSMTTIHANTPRDALTRLENMVAMAGSKCRPKPCRQQISSAIT